LLPYSVILLAVATTGENMLDSLMKMVWTEPTCCVYLLAVAGTDETILVSDINKVYTQQTCYHIV
jgi:hypothetical protein